MEAVSLQGHGTSNAGPSKARRKSRARSKSLAELSPESTSQLPPLLSLAPPTVLRKIPRPPNAFILYRSNKMRELKSKKDTKAPSDVGLDKLDYQRQLSKVIGQLWRDESEEVKAIFYDKAKQAAQEHADRYPEYRFKPSPTKRASAPDPEGSTASQTPERQANTDFSPGDISGPLSGSGSGSGRKRASLEGARSKASPYSTRHRRTSSVGPTSQTPHQATRSMSQQQAPILLYSADDPALYAATDTHLTRSISQGASTAKRTTKASARRSLDGQTSQTATTSSSFQTLVPQHLRDHRVFLAPLPPPPLPIGHAITTDEIATAAEIQARKQPQRPPRPKCSLFDAVKSALPPERRAFLQASLVMKGYSFALGDDNNVGYMEPSSTMMEEITPNPAGSGQTTTQLEQSESWTSTNPTTTTSTLYSTQAWNSQSTSDNVSSQTLGLEAQPASQESSLSPILDPANQEPLSTLTQPGPSLNLHMSASAAQRYGDLADWTQPDLCCSDQSQPQISGANAMEPPPSAYEMFSGQDVDIAPSQRGTAAGDDNLAAHLLPIDSFGAIEFPSYLPIDYNINASNSAFLALSEPNEEGQVQGHFYGLDGHLIGQSIVDGGQAGTYGCVGSAEEEMRQRRAVDELLMQMMVPTSQSNPAMDCQLHPELVGDAAAYLYSNSHEQVALTQDHSQRQEWPGEPEIKLENNVEHELRQSSLFDAASQPSFSLGEHNMTYDGYQPDQPGTQASPIVPVPTRQEWADALAQGQVCDQVASPTTNTNFSRPILYEAQAKEHQEPFASIGSASINVSEEVQSEFEAIVAASRSDTTGAHSRPETMATLSVTVDPARAAQSQEQAQEQTHVSPQPVLQGSHQQRIQQSLRNWKAHHLNTLKDKLARAKHKSTPSTSSISANPTSTGH